jgi:hypothetical protein
MRLFINMCRQWQCQNAAATTTSSAISSSLVSTSTLWLQTHNSMGLCESLPTSSGSSCSTDKRWWWCSCLSRGIVCVFAAIEKDVLSIESEQSVLNRKKSLSKIPIRRFEWAWWRGYRKLNWLHQIPVTNYNTTIKLQRNRIYKCF